jgi:hypothetical protein
MEHGAAAGYLSTGCRPFLFPLLQELQGALKKKQPGKREERKKSDVPTYLPFLEIF